jgi:hypothetical protein
MLFKKRWQRLDVVSSSCTVGLTRVHAHYDFQFHMSRNFASFEAVELKFMSPGTPTDHPGFLHGAPGSFIGHVR